MPVTAKILVVDDDPDVLEVCRLVLKRAGYSVSTASSGAEGRKRLQAALPDLVILDIMMEEADTGFKLAREFGPSVPIVVLSSIAEASSRVFDTTTLTVAAMIDKPIAPDDLLATVRRILKEAPPAGKKA